MSNDLLARLEVGVRRQDRKAADNNLAERALAKEAAARIRELKAENTTARECIANLEESEARLEAENAALREAGAMRAHCDDELRNELARLTCAVTEIGHWNSAPAGSYQNIKFHEAAEELADALYDAWIDGRIALEPARVTVGDNLERVARSIAKQAVNDENSWRDYTYAASAALRALADAGEAGECETYSPPQPCRLAWQEWATTCPRLQSSQ